MIVPMKRLTLVALKDDEERIMRALQAISAVQVIKTESAEDDETALQKAEFSVQKFTSALTLLRPYAKKPSVLDEKPEMTVDELTGCIGNAADISDRLEAADRKKAALRAQIDKRNSEIELLTPWSDLDVKLNEIKSSKHTALFAGRLKTDELVRLDELDKLCAKELYGGEKERAVLILCPLSMKEEVAALIKELNWTDVNFPMLDMSPREAIANCKAEIEALANEQQALEEEMRALGLDRAVIANAFDASVIERDRIASRCALEKTEAAFMLEGWVCSDEVEKVEKALKSATDAYYTEYRDPVEEDGIPPTVVRNSKFAAPFESITNLYSRPLLGSIDGTPLMAPWYVLLFGMMLSDTGYGILLALGCTYFLKRAKPKGMMGDIASVLRLGGISTIIWGVLIGTFFGYDWNVLFGTVDTFPLIVDPGKDPIMMLALCFGLGLLHIFCGVFIKIYMAFRDGDWQTAVFDNISWVLIVFGLLIFGLLPSAGMVGLAMAAIGAAMVLFMKGRGKKVVSRLVSGAGGLYDVTAYLSDVLSYARLFALGIATGVIGSVFNQLIGMIMNASDFIPLKVIFVLIGCALLIFLHIFNLAINTLGTFVHCARLQFVEFYGKFYEVGGKEFKPLGYKTRNSRVTQPNA